MENEGTMTTSMGFNAGGAESSGTSSAPTENVSSGTASGVETLTNDSSATGGSSAIPPNAAAAKEAENTKAQSEKGSFVLRFNERTGRNEVISTMPQQETESAEEAQSDTTAPASQSYAGNELLEFLNNPSPAAAAEQQVAAPAAEYTLPELQEAMQTGQIDEARIPVAMRPGYYAALAQARQQTAPPAQPQQPTPEAEPVDNTAKAREFYGKVQQMAQERAMKEVGITQDELDVSEYTDDQELLNKAKAYQVAVENNRAQILQDVDNIQRQQKAAEDDHAKAYQTIASFVGEMRKKEPNFDAIDNLMISRVAKMPYEEAVKVAPLIQKVQNGSLTTADLPALQEMYNQTRLEFYSKKTGVGLAPKVEKPMFVENPGNGQEAPRQTTPLNALGSMSKRDKEAAIGQMFGSFFDD